MERRPAVGSKCGVGILHVCQVKDHHQERSDNNIDCSPSHLAHYIKKTVTVRFILDHPVYIYIYTHTHTRGTKSRINKINCDLVKFYYMCGSPTPCFFFDKSDTDNNASSALRLYIGVERRGRTEIGDTIRSGDTNTKK